MGKEPICHKFPWKKPSLGTYRSHQQGQKILVELDIYLRYPFLFWRLDKGGRPFQNSCFAAFACCAAGFSPSPVLLQRSHDDRRVYNPQQILADSHGEPNKQIQLTPSDLAGLPSPSGTRLLLPYNNWSSEEIPYLLAARISGSLKSMIHGVRMKELGCLVQRTEGWGKMRQLWSSWPPNFLSAAAFPVLLW